MTLNELGKSKKEESPRERSSGAEPMDSLNACNQYSRGK